MNKKVWEGFWTFIKFRFVDYIIASIGIIIISLWKIIECVAKILWFIPYVLLELILRIVYFFKTKKDDKRLE